MWNVLSNPNVTHIHKEMFFFQMPTSQEYQPVTPSHPLHVMFSCLFPAVWLLTVCEENEQIKWIACINERIKICLKYSTKQRHLSVNL